MTRGCFLLPLLLASTAAAQVTLSLSTTANLNNLQLNQPIDIRVSLASLPANTRLSLLAATIAFDQAAFAPSTQLFRGPIIPNPLSDPLDFVASFYPGLADASFFTFSPNQNFQIGQSGLYCTLRLTPLHPAQGTIHINFADAYAFVPPDSLTPLGAAIGPDLSYTIRPINDNCSGAIDIGDAATTNFDSTFASTDGPPEPNLFSPTNPQISSDLWYRYSPSIPGTIRLSLCGSSFDTRVAIYNDTCPTPTAPNSAMLADDDSCGDSTSHLAFFGDPNTSYLIRIGGNPAAGAGMGVGASRGTGTFTILGCPADFNRDGGIDGGDVSAFFAAWELAKPESDVNDDGGIDGADVGDFLFIWANIQC